MSDIQDRLASINKRASEAQTQRDMQFVALVVSIWLVALGGLLVFFAAAHAEPYFKAQQLDCQEACVSWRK